MLFFCLFVFLACLDPFNFWFVLQRSKQEVTKVVSHVYILEKTTWRYSHTPLAMSCKKVA